MTDVYTAALLPKELSLDDDSSVRHSSGAEVSLTQAQSAPAVTHDITRLYLTDVTLWDCYIHADTVRALSWICFMYFLVSDGKSKISQEYGGCVDNETSASDLDKKYIGYPVISDTLISQTLIFFQLTQTCPAEIFFKKNH